MNKYTQGWSNFQKKKANTDVKMLAATAVASWAMFTLAYLNLI